MKSFDYNEYRKIVANNIEESKNAVMRCGADDAFIKLFINSQDTMHNFVQLLIERIEELEKDL